MILLVHMLFGAAIGSAVKNIPLAIILAFLSHYFLDFIPHIEYDIKNITEKKWKKYLPDSIKVFVDFLLGIILIFIFSNSPAGSWQPIIYVCAFVAILPDGFALLTNSAPNKILKIHNDIHNRQVHFLRDKKISNFWRIISQILVAILSVVLLRF